MNFTTRCIRLAVASSCAAVLTFAAAVNMPAGKVELKSAGALAMGPDGILFVGDSVGEVIVLRRPFIFKRQDRNSLVT